MNRRWFLAACGMVAVAGCTDNGPAAPGNETDDDTGETDDGTDADGDGGGDGGADDTDAGGGDGDATDADGNGGDDTGDAADDGDDTTDDGDGTDGSSDGETAQLGDVHQFAESFAFDFEGSDESGSVQGSGRVAADDSYWQIEADGEVMEMYYVGDELYWVHGEECYRMGGAERDPDEDVDADLDVPEEEEFEDHPELEAVGRDTIDGEEMYVFELSADEVDANGDVTYYVSVETGYLRRVVQEEVTMNFHSWGEVDPIEAPDTDCVDMSEQGG